jgi:hypothetical protein
MPSKTTEKQALVNWGAIISDPQFWAPVIVLAGGLLVLAWIR